MSLWCLGFISEIVFLSLYIFIFVTFMRVAICHVSHLFNSSILGFCSTQGASDLITRPCLNAFAVTHLGMRAGLWTQAGGHLLNIWVALWRCTAATTSALDTRSASSHDLHLVSAARGSTVLLVVSPHWWCSVARKYVARWKQHILHKIFCG